MSLFSPIIGMFNTVFTPYDDVISSSFMVSMDGMYAEISVNYIDINANVRKSVISFEQEEGEVLINAPTEFVEVLYDNSFLRLADEDEITNTFFMSVSDWNVYYKELLKYLVMYYYTFDSSLGDDSDYEKDMF